MYAKKSIDEAKEVARRLEARIVNLANDVARDVAERSPEGDAVAAGLAKARLKVAEAIAALREIEAAGDYLDNSGLLDD